MRRTRAAYHYAIRRLKKDEESIIRERIADAMLNDAGRNFWSEVERLRSQKTSSKLLTDKPTLAVSLLYLLINIASYIRAYHIIEMRCNVS